MVIAIIAILASLLLPSISRAKASAVVRSHWSASARIRFWAALASGLNVIYWLMLGAAIAAWLVALRTMPDIRLGDSAGAPASHAAVEAAAPVNASPAGQGSPAADAQAAERRSQV